MIHALVMTTTNSKGKTVYEVLYHVSDDHPQAYGGAFGDGSFIARFRSKSAAEKFAAVNDAKVEECLNVPKRLIDRWSFMG